MTFATPGETTVMLPGGLPWEGNRYLRRAVLRPFTGREEDWLAQSAHLPSAIKVTRLLSDCVESLEGVAVTPEIARRLLVGDRDLLILRLRAQTLGDVVNAVMSCPACSGRMDVEFRTSEINVNAPPRSAETHSLELDGRTILFRLPTGEDQEAVIALPVEKAVAQLLRRCVVEDGGRDLDPAEFDALAGEMERLAPRIEVELDLTCPECGHTFVAPFDTTAFFFDEMRVNHAGLLREFHTLAFYYHWPERDILSLQRDRRRAYLDLLRDALRQD